MGMDRIIRVFPRRTSDTPNDAYAFVGDPQMWRPDKVDEVHISCSFTWDKEKAMRLAQAWAQYYPTVKVGGPAFGIQEDGFVPGRYIRKGITFTSRGCNNNCPWCLVPEKEGKLREIEDFQAGWNIQDNNLLQCSREHILRVFVMLNEQPRGVYFAGGLETGLVDDWLVDQLMGLRITKIFLAADTKPALEPLREAVKKLEPLALSRDKLGCYVMIGRNESISQAMERLEAVWRIGCMPFAQLFQPPEKWIEYSPAWKKLARLWERPAATKAIHR
ncbi:hypothetical protein ES703_04107 [subsurface metagenome]